jgi:hypothetical protein
MKTNVLYYGDNLDILRHHISDNSIDLIYLDPPFNSQATYNVSFREESGRANSARPNIYMLYVYFDPQIRQTNLIGQVVVHISSVTSALLFPAPRPNLISNGQARTEYRARQSGI